MIPLHRRRWVSRGLAVAAAAACLVVGFAVAASRSSNTRVVYASLALGSDRTATLRVSGLPAAPSGKTYEAWVIPRAGSPRPAGLFHGGGSTTLRLPGVVRADAVVAVTVERAGGVSSPTSQPILSVPA